MIKVQEYFYFYPHCITVYTLHHYPNYWQDKGLSVILDFVRNITQPTMPVQSLDKLARVGQKVDTTAL